MKENNKRTKIIATVSALTIVAAMGITAFAKMPMEGTLKLQRFEITEEQRAEKVESLRERLAQQLADGQITQEQYDERIEAIESGKPMMFNYKMRNPETTEEDKAEMTETMKECLAQQLADGQITQEQYDEMIKAMESGEPVLFHHRMGEPMMFNGERPEMTEEQKAEMTAKMKEGLDKRLADGTITQEKYDEMIKAIESGEPVMFHHRMGEPMMFDGERPEMTEEQKAEMTEKMKEGLDKRLADGTITQEKYDEMIAAMESGEPVMFHHRMGGFGMFDGERPEMTEEQKAEMTEKMKEGLDKRLADGTITQEKYDEMIKAIESGEPVLFQNRIGEPKAFEGEKTQMGGNGRRSKLIGEKDFNRTGKTDF